MKESAEARGATLSGAEAVVEMLKAHGVEILFGLCGDTSLPFYDALARLPHGMRHVLTRDERSAAYMADGYARVSGRVGVCEGPSGGGATYIPPGLAEADESSVPVLCINTDISVSARGRYTLTELDQGALMRPITKWNTVLNRSGEIPRAFRAAFNQMTTGRPGAAHIALPFDVQKGSVNRTDVWGDATLGQYPSRRIAPDPYFIGRAAELLCSASHPVFLCGGGVVIAGAEQELLELAERLSAPVATTISGKGSISDEHPLAVGVVGSNGAKSQGRKVRTISCARSVRRRTNQARAGSRGRGPGARCGRDRGRRCRHAVSLLLGLLPDAENRAAVLLQPRPRRARLLDVGGHRRSFRAAECEVRVGDGRRQLRLHLRRARNRGALSAADYFHRDLQRHVWLDQGGTEVGLRQALLWGRLRNHRPRRGGRRLRGEELARYRAGRSRQDAGRSTLARRAGRRGRHLRAAARRAGAGVRMGGVNGLECWSTGVLF